MFTLLALTTSSGKLFHVVTVHNRKAFRLNDLIPLCSCILALCPLPASLCATSGRAHQFTKMWPLDLNFRKTTGTFSIRFPKKYQHCIISLFVDLRQSSSHEFRVKSMVYREDVKITILLSMNNVTGLV